MLLFFLADCPIGAAKVCRCARLDFNEHEYAAVSGDNVDFRIARVWPVVPGKND